MALMAARSIAFVSSEVSIGERFRRRNSVQIHFVVKFCPTKTNSRQMSFGRYSCCVRTKCSKFPLKTTEENSSLFAIASNKPEAVPGLKGLKHLIEKLSDYVKEWRHVQLMKVIGLLAFTFMVIPSANATDALKTCSCLLKVGVF